MYLASAALDNEIVLWDLHTKEKLAGHSTPATPLSLVWKPKGNALMCSTAAGRLILWENCIPDGHPGPLEVAESPVKAAPASGNASGISWAKVVCTSDSHFDSLCDGNYFFKQQNLLLNTIEI